MFEPSDAPRVFGLPLGADFPKQLIAGLQDRLAGTDPQAMAQVDLVVSTGRMKRRLTSLFLEGGAQLLPRFHQLSDLSTLRRFPSIGPVANPLGRRLNLTQLVKKLLEAEPDLAPQDAAFDLAGSLSALMEEMRGEGVDPTAVTQMELSGDHSEYWARSKKFLGLVQQYFDDPDYVDAQTHSRRTVELLATLWEMSPAQNPVIVAGSTGSRGTTRALMQAVAKLPQGAVILPGYDFDLDADGWDALGAAAATEDHPQYRFYALKSQLGLAQDTVQPWTKTPPIDTSRNRLVSLAMRPAPVTDAWLTEGPKLANIASATAPLSYLEAPSPRAEALAIALRLRQSVQDGIPAAMISPDRVLTRQVSAALQRWGIVADDSAGVPLSLSAPGRLLRQTARMIGQPASPATLLALLKHPLVAPTHRLLANDLELDYLRRNTPFPDRVGCLRWAEKRDKPGAVEWVNWLWDCLEPISALSGLPMSDMLEHHIAASERLAAGPDGDGSGALWDKDAGEKARKVSATIRQAAEQGGILTPAEYTRIFDAVFSGEEVRSPVKAHPHVMIWGTLEARVQGADLVILAGLNDGTWPELPPPDPWLNREMRQKSGLLLPERNIGLSAHDFQQAIASKEVLLTRSVRNADAETVPSRWLNRLTNLLDGLPEGKDALKAMRKRGQSWLDMAQEIERPKEDIPSAERPAPVPPVEVRPKSLSITRIEKLIRDPYWIYAKHVLGLTPLDPFTLSPDAPLRGKLVHKIMEQFLEQTLDGLPDDPRALLMQIAEEVFSQDVPWPATRALWTAKLDRVVDWFVENEVARRASSNPVKPEQDGRSRLDTVAFELTGRVDRIDIGETGQALIYDYKTGTPPSGPQQEFYDKQLPLTAGMVERGAFPVLGRQRVVKTTYIGLGSNPTESELFYEPGDVAKIWSEFEALITSYQDPEKGYPSRRALDKVGYGMEFDTLARFGEWDDTDKPVRIKVGP